MAEPITIDMAFVVMLGAALWTTIHLNVAHRSASPMLLTTLTRRTLLEGLLVVVAWAATRMIAERGVTADLLIQSGVVGCIWATFSFVAWLPFRSPQTVAK